MGITAVTPGTSSDLDGLYRELQPELVRYAEGISSVEGEAKAALEAQAPKRVAIQFRPLRTATWDHRKLGGVY